MRPGYQGVSMTSNLRACSRAVMLAGCAMMAFAPIQAAAQTVAPTTFAMPAQDLGTALTQLGRVTGHEIILSSDLVRGLRAPRLSLTGDVEQALTALLEGSGLTWRRAVSGAFIIGRGTGVSAGFDDASSVLEEVVVTGSRLARSGTFTAPVPVTSLSSDQLRAASPSTLAAGLQVFPAVAPGGGPTQGGSTANGGQNFLNLRDLGPERTLTLLNGRRFVGANASGTVDSNLLPAGLVKRVDIVTGGASAAYGSDAVGGVINFILDTDFTGFKLNAHVGQSMHQDNREKAAVVTYGADFAGSRGHFVANAEFFDNEGVAGDARDGRRRASNIIRNPGGTPSQVTARDVRTPYPLGSLIANGAGGTAANNARFQGIQFAPGGLPIPYDYGTLASNRGLTSGFQSGGDGYRVSTGQEIVRPLRRETVFLRTDFDVTANVTAFAQGIYGATKAVFLNGPTFHNPVVDRGNPYLARVAPEIVAQMTALNVPRLTLNRLTLEEGRHTRSENLNYTTTVLGGLEGRIGRWRWDATYQHGENHNDGRVFDNLIRANAVFAVDAVIAPSGAIVCRATLPGPSFNPAAAGCQPFNPFGFGSPSSESLAYIFGVSEYSTRTKQSVAQANIAGDLFDFPAGPLAVAAGVEHRREEARTVSDPLSQAGAFRLVNTQAFAGEYNIKEVYAEAEAPLLSDLPLVQQLNLNLAARHADYSTSGGVTTWKVGLNWTLNDELRIRGTHSRDIRAPSLFDLFATGRTNSITVDDVLTTGRTYIGVPNRTFGNINLRPEEADSSVVGLVYKPAWAPGFNLAVDYYRIEIADAIATIGGANAVLQCALSNGASEICGFVTRDPTTRAVIATTNQPFNFTVQKTSGYDVELGYRAPLANWRWASDMSGGDPGVLDLRLIVGYIEELRNISPLIATAFNTAGSRGTPHVRAVLTANYERGPWKALLQGRYIGDQVWNRSRTLGVDTDFNHIADRGYLDGQVTYSWNDRWETYINVQNIMDREPAFAPSPTGATPLPTDPGLYDEVGRNVRIGFRYRH